MPSPKYKKAITLKPRPPGTKPKPRPKPAVAREPRSGNMNQNKLLRELKKGGHY